MDIQKPPKGPLSQFLALSDLPETKQNRNKTSKNSDFFQFFLHPGTVEENT